MIGGILPFGACFVELFFILTSMWLGAYYYVFGFLLLVSTILFVTCAEITIVLCYFQVRLPTPSLFPPFRLPSPHTSPDPPPSPSPLP